LLAQETNRALIFETSVKVPMRDGVQLAANNLAAESGANALSSQAASARLTHWIPILRDA
jgi:predicted acyl esterase